MPTTRFGSRAGGLGLERGTYTASRSTTSSNPALGANVHSGLQGGPGPTRWPVSLTHPVASTSVTRRQPVVERRHAARDHNVTRARRRREDQHQTAALPQLTTCEHRPGRGVTRSPGTGPGAKGLSIRCGTPLPAGHPSGPRQPSRTRIWTGTPPATRPEALPSRPPFVATGPTTVTTNWAAGP